MDVRIVQALRLWFVQLVERRSERLVGGVANQLRISVAKGSPVANRGRCPHITVCIHVERSERRIGSLDTAFLKSESAHCLL